jgi:uncharacterized membrane protein (TIGR02234 family)
VSRDRRSFVPVVGAGVAAGALAAVAATRTWVAGFDAARADVPLSPDVAEAGTMPLASALSLVILATWGVVLVTRGWVRRVVAGLGLLASGGFAATVVAGYVGLPDQVAEAVRDSVGTDTAGSEPTAWFWAAAVSALVLVVSSLLAVAWCPAWPEMGSRYDAPAGGPRERPPSEERSNLDLWKSMDEGRDPTA